LEKQIILHKIMKSSEKEIRVALIHLTML